MLSYLYLLQADVLEMRIPLRLAANQIDKAHT